MDAVITYVDGSRKSWIDSYSQKVGGKPSLTRFRDWGTLRFLFRGIADNAPWIRNVHLVVSELDQVPKWLNSERVRIVTHADIIPSKLLPTFSSNVIELWLHMIPELSEEFIYFNDDVFLLNRCLPQDFFVAGKPRLSPRCLTERTTMFRTMIYNSTQMARRILGIPASEQFLMQRHTVAPMTRSSYLYAYERAGREILRSFTPTRSAVNLNDYIFMDLNYLSGKYHPARIDFRYFGLDKGNADSICEHIETSKTKTLCINDGCREEDFPSVRGKILRSFEKRFPDKSKYEL